MEERIPIGDYQFDLSQIRPFVNWFGELNLVCFNLALNVTQTAYRKVKRRTDYEIDRHHEQ